MTAARAIIVPLAVTLATIVGTLCGTGTAGRAASPDRTSYRVLGRVTVAGVEAHVDLVVWAPYLSLSAPHADRDRRHAWLAYCASHISGPGSASSATCCDCNRDTALDLRDFAAAQRGELDEACWFPRPGTVRHTE